MKQHTERFTPAALTLSVVTTALADGIPLSVPAKVLERDAKRNTVLASTGSGRCTSVTP